MKSAYRFLVAILLMMAVVGVEAAPALRGAFTVKQADGSQLTIEQFGDEYHHWTATADGTIVIPTANGYFVAEIDPRGCLIPSSILAHEPAYRSFDEIRLIGEQRVRRALFQERGSALRRSIHINPGQKYFPSHGTPRVLTILAATPDKDFTVNDPVRAFNQYLNGDVQEDLGNHNATNISSVRKYFETSSRGQFSPQFDVVGPVVLPREMSYYGGTNASGSDDKFTTFCSDAVEQAKSLVDDWGIYDNDLDGYVDLVCVIFAGYGQNQGGDNNTIWAKAGYQGFKVDNQYKVARCLCGSELFHPHEKYADYINGTGVFIHEFSHCLGLPDLYATTSKAYVNNQGMESYSVMDYGLYNYNGFAPQLYNAWEQESMGWITIETITEACDVKDLLPVVDGGKAYKIVNANNPLDFIVMENVQLAGLNKYGQGHGLLVYHVDYPATVISSTDAPNNNPGYPGVAVVPASGLLINSYLRGSGKTYSTAQWKANLAAATFPGTGGVVELYDELALPNYCFYQADTPLLTSCALNGIVEDGETGTVSFSANPNVGVGVESIEYGPLTIDHSVYSLQGQRISVSSASSVPSVLPRGLYIVAGMKILVK